MATIEKTLDINTTEEKSFEHLTDPKHLRLGKRSSEEIIFLGGSRQLDAERALSF